MADSDVANGVSLSGNAMYDIFLVLNQDEENEQNMEGVYAQGGVNEANREAGMYDYYQQQEDAVMKDINDNKLTGDKLTTQQMNLSELQAECSSATGQQDGVVQRYKNDSQASGQLLASKSSVMSSMLGVMTSLTSEMGQGLTAN